MYYINRHGTAVNLTRRLVSLTIRTYEVNFPTLNPGPVLFRNELLPEKSWWIKLAPNMPPGEVFLKKVLYQSNKNSQSISNKCYGMTLMNSGISAPVTLGSAEYTCRVGLLQ